jgi:hypothetical protein
VNPRSTGILALVALALGAFIWFYEIEGEEGRKSAEEAEKHLFADLEAEAIEWLAFETTDGASVRVERRDDRWRLVEPLDFPADTVAVDAMAGALADLAHEQAIESGQALEVYGLGPGARRVEFGTASGSHALRIGNKAPLGSNTYVARGADDAVFTVSTWRTNALSEELLDLRDRRVLAFDRNAVRSIEASWQGGRVVIERVGEGWRLREPLDGPADEERVDGLLSDLTYLRTDGFVDDALGDAEAGLDPPDYAVSLELASDDPDAAPRTLRFALGSPRSDGRRLARGTHDTLYALASERIDEFPRELVEYRDRELARFVVSEASALELVFASEPGDEGGGASVRVEIRRDDTGWTSEPPLRQGAGGDMVAALANLKASDIVAESIGDDELEALGLAPPRTRIRILGRPSGEGEIAPVLGELLLGHHDPEQGTFAKRPDRPELFRLDPRQTESLPIDHEAFETHFTKEEAAEEGPAEEGPAEEGRS